MSSLYFFNNFTWMKKYKAIGDLLKDYRKINNISQADFAGNVDVDIRTIQRWEKGVTLIKPEKEDDIVNETLLPYQLIRNLNANIPIQTFYDFSLGKYSLTELTNPLPDSSWFKTYLENTTHRIRNIDYDTDIQYIVKYMQYFKTVTKSIAKVIEESIKILPEMNLIITDESGYYSGHSFVFPINEDTYEKLKRKEMKEDELNVSNLVNYKSQEKPIFYGFDVSANCNDNIFYIINQLFRFIRDLPQQNYLYCSIPYRYDNHDLLIQFGLKKIWDDEDIETEQGLLIDSRFYEGNFKDFLIKK